MRRRRAHLRAVEDELDGLDEEAERVLESRLKPASIGFSLHEQNS